MKKYLWITAIIEKKLTHKGGRNRSWTWFLKKIKEDMGKNGYKDVTVVDRKEWKAVDVV